MAATQAFHFLIPASTLSSFVGCRVYDAVSRDEKRSKKKIQAAADLPLRVLLVSSAVFCLAELIVLSIRQWQAQHTLLPDSQFLYLAGSAVVLLILTSRALPWYGYIAISAITAGLEIALLVISGDSSTPTIVLHVARIAIYLLISTLAFATLCQTSRRQQDREREPLLNGHAQPEDAKKDAKPDDGNESDGDDWRYNKFIADKQAKRRKEAGSMWGYAKAYSLFIPYLLPYGDRKLQLCLTSMCLYLACERALNLLIPRQAGIVTTALERSQQTEAIPLQPILIWLALRFIDSQSGINIINTLASTYYREALALRLDTVALNHVLELSMDFHDDADSAEIMQAVNQGGEIPGLLDSVGLTILPALIDFAIAFLYIGSLLGAHASFVIAIAVAAYFWLDVTWMKLAVGRRRDMARSSRAMYRVSHQAMEGWRTVVYFDRIAYTSQEYATVTYKAMMAVVHYMNFQQLTSAISACCQQLSFGVIILLVALLISQGQATLGTFVTIITYWSSVWGPISTMARNIRYTSSSLIDAERLLLLLQTKPSIVNRAGALPLTITGASIRFRNASFGYVPERKILNEVDFFVEGGSRVALVGETGSGKSTILKLLHRFYDPKEGAIEIDGQDLRDVTISSLRSAIGIVPQDTVLFNSSIMDNVRYGRLDATDDEIYEACKAAAVHDKIMTFPEGYSSKVGSRGVKLSGGEKQRVSIARCLLKNPRILLLDEATSSIDSENEAKIQESLERLCHGRTTVSIAHRLSTIVRSDLIVVMHDGEIVERGTHHELLEKGGRYAELWKKQVAASLDANANDPTTILKE